MGIVFRQSAKTTLVVLTGAVLGAFIIWLSTKYIPKQQFGFIGTLTNYAVVFSHISLLGLNYTLAVYIHRLANDDRKRKLLLTLSLLLPAIFACIATAISFIFRTWILNHFQPGDKPLMTQYFMLVPIYTLLFIYQVLLEQYLGSQMKVALAAFMREVVIRIINIALIFLFAFQYIDFHALVTGMVLMYIVPVTIFFLLSFRTKAFGFTLDFHAFSKTEYIDILHFSWYHFLLNLVIMLMGYMDFLLLPFYDHNGLSSVAVYRVAVFLIALLQLPSKALLSASFTVLAQAFADNDHKKAGDIFYRASINLLIPTLAIALLLCCNLDNVVAVINKGYAEIIPIFLILFIGRIVDISTGMNDQVLSIANYYKFNFYLSLVLMVILFLLIRFLVPHYGMYGAAWSTTFTIVIFNIAKFLFVRKKLDMQPFSKSTLLVILAAVPALAAGYFFPHFFNHVHHVYVHSFLDASLRSIAIIIVYALMILWLKPSDDLQEYIAQIKKNKRLF